MAVSSVLSDQDVVDIAGLVYSKWAESFELLTAVKTEQNDGSSDWQAFHEERLERAMETESKWLGVKNRFNEANSIVIKRAFGL
jgi:hypothetical protein